MTQTTFKTVAEDKARIERDFRVPVTEFRPDRAFYVAALADESDMPTDLELSKIRAYAEHAVRRLYNERYQAIMLGDPNKPDTKNNRYLAADDGHNTVVFKKEAGAWFFRRFSHLHGPTPNRAHEGYRPRNLDELIDGYLLNVTGEHLPDPRWVAHKALFPALWPDPQDPELLAALAAWVERHPEPDEPVLSFGTTTYTPRQLLGAVSNDFGIAAFFSIVPADEIIASLNRSGVPA